MQLVKYDAACRAVAEAKTIDEVKEIGNRAEAARAYARQSKNRQLEIDAMEIRVRAERRLGEIIVTLREKKLLGKQGRVGKNIPLEERLLRLKDIGIDSDDSAKAQRLAMLPPQRFECGIQEWRDRVTCSRAGRVEVPLQEHRIPTIKADRQRLASRLGRLKLDGADRFGKFVAPDGRRVADWRAGELARIESIFVRAAECARSLRDNLPVANPDPLATMEMLFKPDELEPLLSRAWDDTPLAESRGLQSEKIDESRRRRTRTCEHCKKTFVMDARGSSAGKFCSRTCSGRARVRNK